MGYYHDEVTKYAQVFGSMTGMSQVVVLLSILLVIHIKYQPGADSSKRALRQIVLSHSFNFILWL